MRRLVKGISKKLSIEHTDIDDSEITTQTRSSRTSRPSHSRAPKTRISLDTESPTPPRSASPASVSKSNTGAPSAQTNHQYPLEPHVLTDSTDSSEYIPFIPEKTLLGTLPQTSDLQQKIGILKQLSERSTPESAAAQFVKYQTPDMVAEVFVQLPKNLQEALQPYMLKPFARENQKQKLWPILKH
jgi:hypothetical protein